MYGWKALQQQTNNKKSVENARVTSIVDVTHEVVWCYFRLVSDECSCKVGSLSVYHEQDFMTESRSCRVSGSPHTITTYSTQRSIVGNFGPGWVLTRATKSFDHFLLTYFLHLVHPSLLSYEHSLIMWWWTTETRGRLVTITLACSLASSW